MYTYIKFKYILNIFFTESLRKWPNFPFVDRECTKPYVIRPSTPEEKPIQIEKGTIIWIPVYGFHCDPKYYPDPQKFIPERFSDENKHDIKPGTYLPFGVGPRNCIGSRFALLECKILFYNLLLNFELVPIKRTQIPLKLSKQSFNLRPDKNGIWLGFRRVEK